MFVFPNRGDLTQLDCIDTAVNTWTYMTLMERSGLFPFHRVAPLSYAPLRNTAVLQETAGGYFAVDASLVDRSAAPGNAARDVAGRLAPRSRQDRTRGSSGCDRGSAPSLTESRIGNRGFFPTQGAQAAK